MVCAVDIWWNLQSYRIICGPILSTPCDDMPYNVIVSTNLHKWTSVIIIAPRDKKNTQKTNLDVIYNFVILNAIKFINLQMGRNENWSHFSESKSTRWQASAIPHFIRLKQIHIIRSCWFCFFALYKIDHYFTSHLCKIYSFLSHKIPWNIWKSAQ